MTDRESPIPFVMGALMIVFGGIGLWLSIHAWTDGEVFAAVGFGSFLPLVRGMSILVGIVHVIAGLRAITYKGDAPALALAYGVLAYSSLIASWLVVSVPSDTLQEDLWTIGALTSLGWPTIVVLTMLRGNVRRACRTDEVFDELPVAKLLR